MKSLTALFTLLFMIGCKSYDLRSSKRNLAFKEISRLEVGRVSQIEILKNFGQADLETISEDDGSESWIYYEGPNFARLSLTFDPQKKLLASVMWIVSEHDKEQGASFFRLSFPERKFSSHSYSWESADAIYRGHNMIDESKNIAIEMEYGSQNVKFVLIKSSGKIQVRDGFVTIPKPSAVKITADRTRPTSVVKSD